MYLLVIINRSDTLSITTVLKLLFNNVVCVQINVKITNDISMFDTLTKHKI